MNSPVIANLRRDLPEYSALVLDFRLLARLIGLLSQGRAAADLEPIGTILLGQRALRVALWLAGRLARPGLLLVRYALLRALLRRQRCIIRHLRLLSGQVVVRAFVVHQVGRAHQRQVVLVAL